MVLEKIPAHRPGRGRDRRRSGIGASAVALAEAGADVVVSARTATQLDDVAARIEAAGRQALVVPADLSDLDNVARPRDRCVR